MSRPADSGLAILLLLDAQHSPQPAAPRPGRSRGGEDFLPSKRASASRLRAFSKRERRSILRRPRRRPLHRPLLLRTRHLFAIIPIVPARRQAFYLIREFVRTATRRHD